MRPSCLRVAELRFANQFAPLGIISPTNNLLRATLLGCIVGGRPGDGTLQSVRVGDEKYGEVSVG